MRDNFFIEKPKDPEKKHRQYGYADGNYFCSCNSCGCEYIAEKRSYNCFDCAEQISSYQRFAEAPYIHDN